MYRSGSTFTQLLIIGAFTALLCSIPSSGHGAAKQRKPLPPLQVSISPADQSVRPENIQPGDVVAFIVTAVALSDAEEMQISVMLPKGAALKSGELSWSGPVRKHESRSLHFTIKTPDKHNSPIRVRAIMPSSEGHSFSASAHYSLGLQAKSKEKAGAVRPLKKDSKGSDVIEYR